MGYHVGDDVTLEFQTLVDSKPTQPISAKANIFGPTSNFLYEDKPLISGSKVFLKVKGKYITESGKYVAMFEVKLREVGKKNWNINFQVDKLPVSKKIRNRVKKNVEQ